MRSSTHSHPLQWQGSDGKSFNPKAKAVIFSQGDRADAVFYIQSGRAKLTVVSKAGKQATITLLGKAQFVLEDYLYEEAIEHQFVERNL
jgi:CRP-like cAMP-binding protein